MLAVSPIQTFASINYGDVSQFLPFQNEMESDAEFEAANSSQIAAGQLAAGLVQNCAQGKYSIEVKVNDVASQDYCEFTIVKSQSLFDIDDYSQVKLWVKPAYGAKWIEFYSSDAQSSALIKNDLDSDGKFEVGTDLESGKWNLLTLNLTKSSGSLSQIKELRIRANDMSGWYFDDVKSEKSSVYKIDLSKMVNAKTEITNGKLKFKTNSTNTYDINPTILNAGSLGKIDAIKDNKITDIHIDESYANVSGSISSLPTYSKYFTDYTTKPSLIQLSGDGNYLYYSNPDDSNKLYYIDLRTGVKVKAGDQTNINSIKVTYSGGYAAYTDTSKNLYRYTRSSGSVVTVTNNVDIFDMQNSGRVFYCKVIPGYLGYYPGGSLNSDIDIDAIDAPDFGDTLFYADISTDKYYIYSKEPNGWKSKELFTLSTSAVQVLLSNKTGTKLYIQNDGSVYSYHVNSKALRKLDIESIGRIVKTIDDDKLVYQDAYYNYFIYNPDSDESSCIRPSDAKYPASQDLTYFDVECSGKRIAYIPTSSSNGVKVSYIGQPQDPTRYLLSFDGGLLDGSGYCSWYGYKDGEWIKVADAPYGPTSKEYFDVYGMTADEINALDAGDFKSLYENGKQVFGVSIVACMASVDIYTTPVINSIQVNLNEDSEGFSDFSEKLYAVKKESFDTESWRKINKIHPVEISPKDCETYYFIKVDGKYACYDGSQWQDESGSEIAGLLEDVKTNWIEITKKGMSFDGLRSIPASALTDKLKGKDFSVEYCMKVGDTSTEKYQSIVKIDYVEDLFGSNSLILNVTLNSGETKQFTGLSDTDVEEFMEWINQRQYNRGQIFYRIKTGSNNDFLNYYMIQSVTVQEQ